MEESSGASGQLLKAAMAFASHNMAGLLEARSLDDLSDPCCRQLSRFYTEEMRISGRRFTPHSESPTSSELREMAATAGLTADDVLEMEEELLAEMGDLSFNAGNTSSTGPTNATSSGQKKSRKNSTGSSDNNDNRRFSRSSSVSSVCSSGSSVDSDFFDFVQVT